MIAKMGMLWYDVPEIYVVLHNFPGKKAAV